MFLEVRSCVASSPRISYFYHSLFIRRIAIDWVNSTTPYQYDSYSRTFLQQALARDVLRQLASFNNDAMTPLTLTEDATFERSVVSAGSAMRALIDIGINDPTAAPSVLRMTLEQLAKQSR